MKDQEQMSTDLESSAKKYREFCDAVDSELRALNITEITSSIENTPAVGLRIIMKLQRALEDETSKEQATRTIFKWLAGYPELCSTSSAADRKYSIKQILEEEKEMEKQYELRSSVLAYYKTLRHKIQSFRNTYCQDIDECISKRAEEGNTASNRTTIIFNKMIKEDHGLKSRLVKIFRDFYQLRLKNRSIPEKILLRNVERMFNAVANLPALFTVFPFYIFVMFTQHYDLMIEDISSIEDEGNRAKKSAKFYPKFFFNKYAFSSKEFTPWQYTKLYREIQNAVYKPERINLDDRTSLSIEQINQMYQQSKTLFMQARAPIIISTLLSNCLKTKFELSADQVKYYEEMWNNLYYWKKRTKSAHAQLIRQLREDIIGSLLIDLCRLFKPEAYLEIQFDINLNSHEQSALNRIWESKIVDDEDRTELNDLFSPEAKKNSERIRWQYDCIGRKISMRHINLSRIIFRVVTRFYDYLPNEEERDPFEASIIDGWYKVVEFTYEHRFDWGVDEYQKRSLLKPIKMINNRLERIILKHNWTSAEVYNWLQAQTELKDVTLKGKRVSYMDKQDPFEKAVFKHWFLKTLVVPEEICLILSETNLESDYLWDHAFHTVLQQSLQTIFFDLMQALNMDE